MLTCWKGKADKEQASKCVALSDIDITIVKRGREGVQEIEGRGEKGKMELLFILGNSGKLF